MSEGSPDTDPQPDRGPLGWIAFVLYGGGATGWPGFIRNLIVIISIAMVFRWAVIEPYRIPSGSMEPTLHGDPRWWVGDRVFVNKWVYGLRVPFKNARLWKGEDPQRFDIVVFKSVEEDAQYPILVKRVIGLPGERVAIRSGRIWIDGEPIEMPPDLKENFYTTYGRYGVLDDEEHSHVPEGHYLVMGDNSPHSRDGREFGWLPHENILGRVASIWWPIGRIRDFTGFSDTLWWRTFTAIAVSYVIWRMFFGRSWPVWGTVLGPNLAPRSKLYINRIVFGWHFPLTRIRIIPGRTPRRGELVAFYADWENDLVVLAGRVVAMPGEAVSIHGGRIYVNEEDAGPAPADAEDEWSVDAGGGYVILSDDKKHLPDSRAVGRVRGSDLIGPAPFIWWPPAKWGAVPPRIAE